MNSGQYDKDCTTWNPQGDITQIKHAMEAVKQGTVVLALKSDKVAVLACYKEKITGAAQDKKKLFKIDDHMGIGIAGMTADGRVLTNYMRMECLNHKYVFDDAMNAGKLVTQLGDKAQRQTLKAGKRPYGVGLLVASVDEGKAHIYETNPSGNYYEYYAMAIGQRSQSAKTYLEKNFESFPNASVEQLVKHAVKALAVATEQNTELTTRNVDVQIVTGLGDGKVGRPEGCKLLSEAELKPYVDEVAREDNGGAAPMDTA